MYLSRNVDVTKDSRHIPMLKSGKSKLYRTNPHLLLPPFAVLNHQLILSLAMLKHVGKQYLAHLSVLPHMLSVTSFALFPSCILDNIQVCYTCHLSSYCLLYLSNE